MGTMNETDLEILEYGKTFTQRPMSVYDLIEDHKRLRDLNKAIERAYAIANADVERRAKELLESRGYVSGADIGNMTIYQIKDLMDQF